MRKGFFFFMGEEDVGLELWRKVELWRHKSYKTTLKIRWIHIHMVLLPKDLCNNNGTNCIQQTRFMNHDE